MSVCVFACVCVCVCEASICSMERETGKGQFTGYEADLQKAAELEINPSDLFMQGEERRGTCSDPGGVLLKRRDCHAGSGFTSGHVSI